MLRALRFMQVVPPLPRLMHVTMACVVVVGMSVIALDPAAAPHALVPLLTLQLFAVSTGFSAYVRRGYYDLLLTGGTGRTTVAAAQWVMAALPGMAAWLGLALVEAVAQGGWPALLSAGAAAAVWMASTLPWACTVALPRFSAAIGLSVAAVTLVTLGPHAADALAALVAGTVPATLLPGAGHPLRFADPVAQAGALWADAAGGFAVASTLAMLGALAWIRQASFPLESGQ